MATKPDNPITTHVDDVLERADLARSWVAELTSMDVSSGLVVAIMGQWGSGKSSMINLMREVLSSSTPKVEVLEFNPWLLSNTEQLVGAFFAELAAQMRDKGERLKKFADDLDSYGRELLSPISVIPFVGAWFERFRAVPKSLHKYAEGRKSGVTSKKANLAKKLAALTSPIVVVIDDIDRLDSREIREVFKLVRLTANFPNLICILAFDRNRVEQALAEEEHAGQGRAYLEKIVQISFSVPSVPSEMMLNRLTKAINESVDEVEPDVPHDSGRWQDVFAEIIFPLIKARRAAARRCGCVRAPRAARHGSAYRSAPGRPAARRGARQPRNVSRRVMSRGPN